jgi:hypothetical protein
MRLSVHAVLVCVFVRLGKNVLVERCGVMYKNCGTEHKMVETSCFTLSGTMGHVFRCIRADQDNITVYVDPKQRLLQQSCESCKEKRLQAVSKGKRLVAIPPPPPSVFSTTTSLPKVSEPPEHAVRMQNVPRGFESFSNNLDPETNLSGSCSLSNGQGLSQVFDANLCLDSFVSDCGHVQAPTDEDDSWVLVKVDGSSGMALEQEDTTAMLQEPSSWSQTSSMQDRNSRVSGFSSLSIDDKPKTSSFLKGLLKGQDRNSRASGCSSLSIDDKPKTSSFLKGLFNGESNESWLFEVNSLSSMTTLDECKNTTDVGRSMSQVLERSDICCSAVEKEDTHTTRSMHRSSGTATFVAAAPELSSMVFN